MADSNQKEFKCWKCKFLLFLYRIKLSVVIRCPQCEEMNRAGAGSEKYKINAQKAKSSV